MGHQVSIYYISIIIEITIDIVLSSGIVWSMENKTAAKCLEALGNETRLSIFRHLVQAGQKGVPVGNIQKKLNIPNSTLSHHLAKMVQVELVSQERQSRTLICKANYDLMDAFVAYLTEYCCAGDSENESC